MIINSLTHYRNDIELMWLSGHFQDSNHNRYLSVRFRNCADQVYFQEKISFSCLPFLMPGLVVSRGELQSARASGKNGQANLTDLSAAEEIDVIPTIPPDLYYLGGHRGGGQRILRYHSNGWTILIPAVELIRFLFLHSRTLAQALLIPSGLQTLGVSPVPGLRSEIEIHFTSDMPRRLLSEDFIREFAWLSVHPDGRQAWDSVRRRSTSRILTFDPPPIQDCLLEFRGIKRNRQWLVLEILSLSGRKQPALNIVWSHPSEYESFSPDISDGKHTVSDGHERSERRPAHELEHVVEDEADSQRNANQDVIFLGGKRGCFVDKSRVTKHLLPPRPGTEGKDPASRRKTRSDAGHPINSDLPSTLVRKLVSVGEPALSGGLQPVEFSTLDQVGADHIGDLSLLELVLWRIETSTPDVTLTLRLVPLKSGRAISFVGRRRRACLIAVFTSPKRLPRVLLDVDHTGLSGGLSGLLLRYDAATPMTEIAGHVRLLLATMVDRHGHWDIFNEHRLPRHVFVKRLPKLVRMTERREDEQYVLGWVMRLKEEIIT